METVTIDILNRKAIKLLKELENLHLIRLRKDIKQPDSSILSVGKYKGKMKKQSLTEIDEQLKELRSAWE
jgi:hypothetical protein